MKQTKLILILFMIIICSFVVSSALVLDINLTDSIYLPINNSYFQDIDYPFRVNFTLTQTDGNAECHFITDTYPTATGYYEINVLAGLSNSTYNFTYDYDNTQPRIIYINCSDGITSNKQSAIKILNYRYTDEQLNKGNDIFFFFHIAKNNANGTYSQMTTGTTQALFPIIVGMFDYGIVLFVLVIVIVILISAIAFMKSKIKLK